MRSSLVPFVTSLLVLLMFSSFPLYSNSTRQELNKIKKEVQGIVEKVDTNSMVLLKVIGEKELNVTIFTKKGIFPEEAIERVKTHFSDKGYNSHVNIKMLSSSYFLKNKKKKARGSSSDEFEKKLAEVKAGIERVEKWNRKQDKSIEMISIFNRIIQNPVSITIIVLSIIALVMVSGGFFKGGKKRADSIAKSIENGIMKIITSLKEVDFGKKRSPSFDMSDVMKTIRTIKEPSKSDATILKDFTFEGVLAILTDCYWSENDPYASYIWKRIPLELKHSLVKKVSFLEEYAKYISTLEEKNLGYEQDPYYLAPIPVFHINNRILTELIREYPALFGLISDLRKESLTLSLKERIIITEIDWGEDIEIPDFTKIEPSPIRYIKNNTKLTISSIDEEIEVLEMENFPIELMEQIPTLAWLAFLDDNRISKIMQKFSARELAKAWIGPEEILERLLEILPGRKQDLLQSYKETIIPSRESYVFRTLHRESIKVFREDLEHHTKQGETKDDAEKVA